MNAIFLAVFVDKHKRAFSLVGPVLKFRDIPDCYLVIYKLFVVVIIVIVIISSSSIIIRICEFGVLYGTFCLIKCYILELDNACENKSDQRKIPMEC